jgi:hypothetical protein
MDTTILFFRTRFSAARFYDHEWSDQSEPDKLIHTKAGLDQNPFERSGRETTWKLDIVEERVEEEAAWAVRDLDYLQIGGEEGRVDMLEKYFDVKLRSDEIRGIQGLLSEIKTPWEDL